MDRLFQIVAVILTGIAAYFLWKGNGENAFAVGVFGAVSFFLSLRFQAKSRLRQTEIEREKESSAGGGNRQLTENAAFDESLNHQEQRTKDEVL